MGTQEIKGADLKRLLEAFPLEARKRMATDLAALDRLVREELVRQFIVGEAKQQGWDKKPDVQLAMDRARDQALLQAYVNNLARPPASYPTDDEIKEAYEASKANLTVPAEYQLAQIYVSSPENADKTVAANAQKKVRACRRHLPTSQRSPRKAQSTRKAVPIVEIWVGCQRRSSSRNSRRSHAHEQE